MDGSAIIILVDADYLSQTLLLRALSKDMPAARVVPCATVADAKEAARMQAPGAIIAHRARDASGPEVVRALKQAFPKVPIVAVALADLAKEALNAGAERFLPLGQVRKIRAALEQFLAPGQPA